MRTEKLTQADIDKAVHARLSAIVPILTLLQGQGADGSKDAPFSDDELSTLCAAQTVAWDAAMYLGSEILGESTGDHVTALASDVQKFFAVTACALADMEAGERSGWVAGPHPVGYLLELAEGLYDRTFMGARGRTGRVVEEVAHV